MRFSRKLIPIIVICIAIIAAIVTVAIQIKNASNINENALIKPKSITLDHSLPKDTVNQMIRAARLYYTYWDSGETKYLNAVISPSFIDNTLPKGLPQGPDGIKVALADFRKFLPDLHCSVEELLITGDKVTARLTLTGTFLGEFMGHQPTGKPVKFIAIDILHIQKGQLIGIWHLEDNMDLLRQLNVFPAT